MGRFAAAHRSRCKAFTVSRLPNEVMALYPYQVSGGMQQRVTIATELALRPALVVLVEPTTALDADVQREIVSILQTMRNKHNTSYLLISHDIHLVRSLADRVGVMQAGRIVETGET